MNLINQPANSWMFYGLQVAAFALKPLGRLYLSRPKDRGIVTLAKRMKEVFGNVETLTISKGRPDSGHRSAALSILLRLCLCQCSLKVS